MKTPDHHAAVMDAMCKHAIASAAYCFHAGRKELYAVECSAAFNELDALGALDMKGDVDVTLTDEEHATLDRIYAAEFDRLQGGSDIETPWSTELARKQAQTQEVAE